MFWDTLLLKLPMKIRHRLRETRSPTVPDPFVRTEPLAISAAASTSIYIGSFHRLRVIHHWLYEDALRRATVILDTFPYGGCLTVLEVRRPLLKSSQVE